MSQFGRVGEASRYPTQSRPLWHGMIGFTVDDFIAKFGAACPTHLKLDVDGLEWPILQGARATLSDARLRSAMVEISLTNGSERAASLALMRECGFDARLKGGGSGIVRGTGGESCVREGRDERLGAASADPQSCTRSARSNTSKAFDVPVIDCDACGCRFTTHDASVHDLFQREPTLSYYREYHDLGGNVATWWQPAIYPG